MCVSGDAHTQQKLGNDREIVSTPMLCLHFLQLQNMLYSKMLGFFAVIFHQHLSVLVFGFILLIYLCVKLISIIESVVIESNHNK